MRPTPLVSVHLVTYNQEKYIAETISSVLGQTISDLELVIVDDGSTDGTGRIVAQFDDPRITYIRQDNQGPSAATNRGVPVCRGRYIAMMTGDDVCHPDRLAVELEAHTRAGGGIVFSDIDYIDDQGSPLDACYLPKGLFDTAAMTQAQILNRFFHHGNFINAVTAFTETQTMRSSGLFDPALYQLQDYDMWIRLVQKHPFTFLRRPTIHYRIHRHSGNLSAPTPPRIVRTWNEQFLIFRRFFDGVPVELFQEAFGDQFVNPRSSAPLELACEQAFLLLRHHFPLARLIGMEKLHGLLQEPESAQVLREQFSFTVPHFADLLLRLDPLNWLPRFRSLLYVDTGKGFNDTEVCETLANHSAEKFELTYDLAKYPPVTMLRWDPVELQFCRVWLEEVSWEDRAGQVHSVDPASAWSNGQRSADGSHEFQTLDPVIHLPIAGDVVRITVRGRWQVLDQPETWRRTIGLLQNQDAAFRRSEQTLRERVVQLQERDRQLHALTQQLQERDRQSQVQERQLQEQERQLHERDLQLYERHKELLDLAQRLQDRERELGAVKSSKSWRFVNWLRSRLPVRKGRKAG
jgi:glycosyltransferase involved in cell wall biosynthesis